MIPAVPAAARSAASAPSSSRAPAAIATGAPGPVGSEPSRADLQRALRTVTDIGTGAAPFDVVRRVARLQRVYDAAREPRARFAAALGTLIMTVRYQGPVTRAIANLVDAGQRYDLARATLADFERQHGLSRRRTLPEGFNNAKAGPGIQRRWQSLLERLAYLRDQYERAVRLVDKLTAELSPPQAPPSQPKRAGR